MHCVVPPRGLRFADRRPYSVKQGTTRETFADAEPGHAPASRSLPPRPRSSGYRPDTSERCDDGFPWRAAGRGRRREGRNEACDRFRRRLGGRHVVCPRLRTLRSPGSRIVRPSRASVTLEIAPKRRSCKVARAVARNWVRTTKCDPDGRASKNCTLHLTRPWGCGATSFGSEPYYVRCTRNFWASDVGRSDHGHGHVRLVKLLFSTPTGERLRRENVYRRVLAPAAEVAGVEWAAFHTFRHTCASLLFAASRNIKQVQAWLGHHSAAFTLATYVHLMDDGAGDADFLDDECRRARARASKGDAGGQTGGGNDVTDRVARLESRDFRRERQPR